MYIILEHFDMNIQYNQLKTNNYPILFKLMFSVHIYRLSKKFVWIFGVNDLLNNIAYLLFRKYLYINLALAVCFYCGVYNIQVSN